MDAATLQHHAENISSRPSVTCRAPVCPNSCIGNGAEAKYAMLAQRYPAAAVRADPIEAVFRGAKCVTEVVQSVRGSIKWNGLCQKPRPFIRVCCRQRMVNRNLHALPKTTT